MKRSLFGPKPGSDIGVKMWYYVTWRHDMLIVHIFTSMVMLSSLAIVLSSLGMICYHHRHDIWAGLNSCVQRVYIYGSHDCASALQMLVWSMFRMGHDDTVDYVIITGRSCWLCHVIDHLSSLGMICYHHRSCSSLADWSSLTYPSPNPHFPTLNPDFPSPNPHLSLTQPSILTQPSLIPHISLIQPSPILHDLLIVLSSLAYRSIITGEVGETYV